MSFVFSQPSINLQPINPSFIMDPPEFLGDGGGGDRSPTKKEIQGPRPTPLKVNKDSYKIRKPPVYRQTAHHQPPRPPLPRQPVIIYALSPKVIYTTVGDFMNLVQSLTGHTTTSGGGVSPAARLASVEKTCPSEREKEREKTAAGLMEMVEEVEVSQIPGILSPAPATLQPISPGFFSPVSDPPSLSLFNDLSPFMYGNNMFIPSPSTLFSAPVLSPSPSFFDFLNPFLDF